MRAKITVKKLTRRLLKFDYQYRMAAMLLGKLGDVNFELASELHSSQDFKFYTFSWLQGEIRPTRSGLEFDEAYFILSSPDPVFVRSFSEGLLQLPEFRLGSLDFIVTGIEIFPARQFEKRAHFRTLSPIYLKTLRDSENGPVVYDLYPDEGKFYENLHTNLVERFRAFYGKEPEDDHFDVVRRGKFEPKRVSIKGSFRRCSLFDFVVEASPELLKFGYEAGFGEKTAMGFGCGEIAGERGEKERASLTGWML